MSLTRYLGRATLTTLWCNFCRALSQRVALLSVVALVVRQGSVCLPAIPLLTVLYVDQAPASLASANMRAPLLRVRCSQSHMVLRPLIVSQALRQ